ncbi:hypothetical protein KFU94_70530 [Chloroflexi bacterium TSY]|nr:hypothetical protein [Chloroflexi bacterium TSY]
MPNIKLDIRFLSIIVLILGIESIFSAGIGLWSGRSTLAKIRAENYLICGISDTVGFGDDKLDYRTQDRELEDKYPDYDFYIDAKGFEAALCRAIAIAILEQVRACVCPVNRQKSLKANPKNKIYARRGSELGLHFDT